MSVIISFCKAKGIRGNSGNPAIAEVRLREDESLDGVTTATVQAGEIVLIGNNETSMISVAFGTTPDADALLATDATSAGVPVPAGSVLALTPPTGSKISVKAL